MPEPHLRAADADRTAVATQLGDQMSAGRLTVAEYDERLARAYAARTYGELEALTADLPRPAAQPPAPAPAARPAVHGGCGWSGGPSREAAWRNWAVVAVIVLTVWTANAIATRTALLLADVGHRPVGARCCSPRRSAAGAATTTGGAG
jgi:hypothetical protein